MTVGARRDTDVQLTIDADLLHDLMLDRLEPGQIARALDEDRLLVCGSPQALIAIAGPLSESWQRCLRDRGKQDLLNLPEPEPVGFWSRYVDPDTFLTREIGWRQRQRREQAAARAARASS